jgi:1-pyrroline-4-hydroxy-2-carboxylate deaminase
MNWSGVMPAVTTPFKRDLSIDHELLSRHTTWLLENGCNGLVMLGSLGEGATLESIEKREILKAAESAGCSGLMVLPPYVYTSDWREMKQHVVAIFSATSLPCMLYNNPVAYGTDFVPSQIAELAQEFDNLQAVKESSADVRRVMAIREILGDRLKILVGVDDLVVEAVYAGATGWIAGLVNAFPRESVELFELAKAGRRSEALELYRWFLPLLRMDTVPKFVQLIKWVQAETGTGSAEVRPPRLELVGAELEAAKTILTTALPARPVVKSSPFPSLEER